MYKIKNKTKDTRTFRDSFSGKNIYIEPGRTVLTKTPIKSSDVWGVEEVKEIEQTEKKAKILKKPTKEVNENDSNSSR